MFPFVLNIQRERERDGEKRGGKENDREKESSDHLVVGCFVKRNKNIMEVYQLKVDNTRHKLSFEPVLNCLHTTTHNIHFHRCCRFSLDTSFFSFILALLCSVLPAPFVIRYLLSSIFLFSAVSFFFVVSHLVLLQFTTGVKVVCYFWPLCQVFPYFFISFNRNYLFSQSLFYSLDLASTPENEDTTHSIAQMHTQSKNFINLLPSITYVSVCEPRAKPERCSISLCVVAVLLVMVVVVAMCFSV